MSFKLQYASDLHLEFRANLLYIKQHPLQAIGEVLVLSGDIVPFAVMDKHNDFFNFLSDNFETTYWLPGNHEYYNFDLFKKCGTFQEKIRSNVFLINNTAIEHKNTKMIFSTLWSKISPAHQWQIERSMNDFHVIKYKGFCFSAEQYNQLYDESLAFIKTELENNTAENIAIFTHHCPTFLNYPAQYQGDALNDAFAVELFDLIASSKINFWIYGHHHTNTPEFTIGKTKLLANQLGYVQHQEHGTFDTNKYIDL